MFLDVASTHTKCILNDFALAPRTDLLNLRCHTVTNGTDLRKSPLHSIDTQCMEYSSAKKMIFIKIISKLS